MTDDTRVLALLKDVLDDLPMAAPDRLLTSILHDIQAAPQRHRPSAVLGWRRLVSNKSVRPIAAGLVLVGVVGVIAVSQITSRPATSGPGTTSSPNPSESAAPSPSAFSSATAAAKLGEWYMPMSPGRYVMLESNTDGVGKWPVGQVIVTVPDGWTQWGPWRGGGILKGSDPEAAIARLTFGRLGALDPKPSQCATPLRQPGSSVDDLVTSLQADPGVHVADVTIGGYAGKVVEFTIPDPTPDCWPLRGWSTPSGGEQWDYDWSPGSHHQLLILDVDGVRFVIDASYRLDAPPEVAAELQAIVDSIELQ